jgi:hypothetical protein
MIRPTALPRFVNFTDACENPRFTVSGAQA